MTAVWLACLLALAAVHAQDNGCSSKESCDDCLRSPDCVWCGNPDLGTADNDDPARCKERGTILPGWCEEYIIDQKPELNVVLNNTLKDSEGGEVVQLAPQKIKLRLRVGKPETLTIRYRHALDYPVDLYYLMDLSNSMKDNKDSLSRLGDDIAARMQNITRNFRLGFGSFVDKVAMPFTSTLESRIKNPCPPNKCAPPFSFVNNMPLTNDTKSFKTEVNNTEVSGNLDSPEGGLDALMQAIVCEDIGWRKKARRMIIFSTDAPFHIAGDGRLAGIVEPNDGLCHLNDKREYTESLRFDYPSISQINRKARENQTHVIFAVTKKHLQTYTILSSGIPGSSVRELKKNSSNVVDLVVEEYMKLADKVELEDNRSGNLEVRYYSKCLKFGQENETTVCNGLKRGIQVAFTVNITAKFCPKDAGQIARQELYINPIGISEKILVELEIICGCSCSKGGMNEANSEKCNRNGDLECGVCKCHRGYLGDRCRCQSDSSSPEMEETAACKDSRNETCSGHGTCVCNSCECHSRPDKNERFYGTLCKCNNFSCKRHEGKVCAEHGECDCGECKCKPGWSGEACQCADTLEDCRRPGETTVCSDRGHCQCGECSCSKTDDGHHYSGQYCEECPSCPGALCKDYEVCAEYKWNNTQMPSELKKLYKCDDVAVVDNIKSGDAEDYDSYDSSQDKICPVADRDGCTLYFRYRFSEGSHRIWVQKEKECGPNIWGVIFGVVGATVLLGLLIILVWKIYTSIHDRREYAKFEKEREMSKWHRDGNPLYQPSTSTFTNPTFNKS